MPTLQKATLQLFALILIGCGGAETPPGTVLLTHDFSSALPNQLEGGETSTRTTSLGLRLGSSIDVEVTTVADGPDEYIRLVEFRVVDADGSVVSAGISGEPVNAAVTDRGVLMEQTFLLTESQSGLLSDESAATEVVVRGTGRAAAL